MALNRTFWVGIFCFVAIGIRSAAGLEPVVVPTTPVELHRFASPNSNDSASQILINHNHQVAATVSLVGLTLGATVNRKLFVLPGIVAGFLLQHAIQGWCPPVPVFRRLGFRTAAEIDYERYALKLLRGDFDHLRSEDVNVSSAAELVQTMRQ